ncbi:MAG: PTS alpha-glucoside transporter subunit IIBC [Patescibacteria group bacterium]
MDVIIVCHSEFGFVQGRRLIFDKKATKGVSEGVHNLVRLCERYGAKITFAVCPEVADYFPKELDHEIGLHVHPGWEKFQAKGYEWYVGDTYLRAHCRQSQTSSALAHYSYEEQLEMIQVGKEYIKQKLAREPKVFVAGRWSLTINTIKALVQTGFTHDCSAVPGFKINDTDWSKLPRICLPYHPNEHAYEEKGDLPLVMVPVSQLLFGVSANPESARICGFPWLRAGFSEYYGKRVPLFHIALHSPAMTDSYYLRIMDKLLSFIARDHDISFRFASEIHEYPEREYRAGLKFYLLAWNLDIAKSGVRKLLGAFHRV